MAEVGDPVAVDAHQLALPANWTEEVRKFSDVSNIVKVSDSDLNLQKKIALVFQKAFIYYNLV